MISPDTRLQVAQRVTDWELSKSLLGKTVWSDGENSMFIADMNIYQPHGYAPDHAEYCVEAMGPGIRDSNAVVYWHHDSFEDAVDKIVSVMREQYGEEKFEREALEVLMS